MTQSEEGVKDNASVPPTDSETEHGSVNSESTSHEETEQGESQNASVKAFGEEKSDGANKTYTKEEVQQIVHQRTKEMSELKRQLELVRQYLVEQSQKQSQTLKQEDKLGEDDLKFKEYIYKLIPGLATLEKMHPEMFDKLPDIVSKEEASYQSYVDATEREINKYCSEKGITGDSIDAFKHYVAAVIANNTGLISKWNSRDVSVLADAFKIVEKGFIEPFTNSKIKDISKIKGEVNKIREPIKGGIPAPNNSSKSMSFSELSDKAFNALHERMKNK